MLTSLQSKSRYTWVLSFCALAAAIVFVPTATAGLITSCTLAPGSSCSPPDDAGDAPGTLLAARIDPFSFTTASGITDGAIKTEVFRESGGTLDFYYIIFNAPNSATSVMGEMEMDFSGWTTAVAFRSDGSSVPGFVDGNIAPLSASRDVAGSIIGFNFGGIPPNERSRVVIVSTNAVSFGPGSMVVDGSSQLAAFQPTVPEPTTFGLLIVGLFLAAVRKSCLRSELF